MIFLSDVFHVVVTYETGTVRQQPGHAHSPCSLCVIDKERSVLRIKTKGSSGGVCNQRGLSKAGGDCPCTQHTCAQQAVLVSLKSPCNCFTFDIPAAEADVTHQGHPARDEWIFDLGWWLGTGS